MLCQRCKKNDATVHIKQTINGVKTELMLCSECAEKENAYSFFPEDLFSGFFADSILGTRRAEEQRKCPKCGISRRELAASGRAGCAQCYEFFAPELEKIIYGIHGNAKHTGSVPGTHTEQLKKRKEIEALKKEQSEAIAEQNYEKAAELRDKIRELESGENK